MKTKIYLTTIFFVLLSVIAKSQNSDSVLCSIKSAALYEPTLRSNYLGQSALTVLSPMNIDFLMRGFFKWGYHPNANLIYSLLALNIIELKQAKPNLLYQGAITASRIDTIDTWPDFITPLSNDDINNCKCYDTSGNAIPFLGGYMADIASPIFRNFIVGWAKKQIDAGVDAMFFDERLKCAEIKISQGADLVTTLNQYAQYFQEIADSVRAYASSQSKKVYITTNSNAIFFQPQFISYIASSYNMLDFITMSFNKNNFYPPYMPQENWIQIKYLVDSIMGRSVPVIVFIDWTENCYDCQLTLFSQLSSNLQNTLLHRLDSATKSAGVIFAYPVYGGNASAINDSLYDAMKFNTYDTIVYMANNPSIVPTCNSINQIFSCSVIQNNIVNIFPNPSSVKFIIEMKHEKGGIANSVIEIYNIMGRIVFQFPITSEKSEINLSLSSGIYIYIVKDNKQFISTGKLIIQ